jgi:hypothetical protein
MSNNDNEPSSEATDQPAELLRPRSLGLPPRRGVMPIYRAEVSAVTSDIDPRTIRPYGPPSVPRPSTEATDD